MDFNDLLYLGRVTDEEREEWERFKRGKTVKSKLMKSKRELRKDYVKILEKKRKEADKARGTLPDRQKAPRRDRKGDCCTHFVL